jgi:hypothetical protein
LIFEHGEVCAGDGFGLSERSSRPGGSPAIPSALAAEPSPTASPLPPAPSSNRTCSPSSASSCSTPPRSAKQRVGARTSAREPTQTSLRRIPRRRKETWARHVRRRHRRARNRTHRDHPPPPAHPQPKARSTTRPPPRHQRGHRGHHPARRARTSADTSPSQIKDPGGQECVHPHAPGGGTAAALSRNDYGSRVICATWSRTR